MITPCQDYQTQLLLQFPLKSVGEPARLAKVPPLGQASILDLLPDSWTPRQVGWRLFQSQANQVLSLLALENPPYVKNSHLPHTSSSLS